MMLENLSKGSIVIPILQMKKLRLREMMSLTQGPQLVRSRAQFEPSPSLYVPRAREAEASYLQALRF